MLCDVNNAFMSLSSLEKRESRAGLYLVLYSSNSILTAMRSITFTVVVDFSPPPPRTLADIILLDRSPKEILLM